MKKRINKLSVAYRDMTKYDREKGIVSIPLDIKTDMETGECTCSMKKLCFKEWEISNGKKKK